MSKCHTIRLPDDEKLRAAFCGLLIDLAEARNWEQEGTATPEEIAELFLALESENTELNECVTGGGTLPVGSVFWFAASTPPVDCLVCDGSGVDKNVYPDLFSAIGYQFGGSGDTFNLPDLSGAFARGVSGSVALASSGGAAEVALTGGEIPSHTHTVRRGTSGLQIVGLATSERTDEIAYTGAFGNGEAHENLPPYVALTPVIKATT